MNLPHLYLVPSLGVIPSEFRQDFWQRKTRVPALSYAILSVILGLAIFVQLRLVSDGHEGTDRQTDRHNNNNNNNNPICNAPGASTDPEARKHKMTANNALA